MGQKIVSFLLISEVEQEWYLGWEKVFKEVSSVRGVPLHTFLGAWKTTVCSRLSRFHTVTDPS